MTASSLPAALRAGADGLYALEAATGLIMAHASWLAREDFARYIDVGIGITDPRTEMASIDWEATISALDAGELPSSAASGECSASRPASPTRPLSASATPSPASTTGWTCNGTGTHVKPGSGEVKLGGSGACRPWRAGLS